MLKLKIRSRKGSVREKVTLGPPSGNRSTAGDMITELRLKSGCFAMVSFLFSLGDDDDDSLQSSAKVLKKFQKEVPSVTA